MTGSYHTWRESPKGKYRKPAPYEGSAVMTSRASAIADALSPEKREKIRAAAVEAAADAIATFENRRRKR